MPASIISGKQQQLRGASARTRQSMEASSGHLQRQKVLVLGGNQIVQKKKKELHEYAVLACIALCSRRERDEE